MRLPKMATPTCPGHRRKPWLKAGLMSTRPIERATRILLLLTVAAGTAGCAFTNMYIYSKKPNAYPPPTPSVSNVLVREDGAVAIECTRLPRPSWLLAEAEAVEAWLQSQAAATMSRGSSM